MRLFQANAEGTDLGLEIDGVIYAVKPDDPRIGDLVAEPYVPTQIVPAEITNFQARAVLMQLEGSAPGRTLFNDIDDALRASGGAAWQAWEYANTVSRNGTLVAEMAAQFGLSDEQLDTWFIQGAAISA